MKFRLAPPGFALASGPDDSCVIAGPPAFGIGKSLGMFTWRTGPFTWRTGRSYHTCAVGGGHPTSRIDLQKNFFRKLIFSQKNDKKIVKNLKIFLNIRVPPYVFSQIFKNFVRMDRSIPKIRLMDDWQGGDSPPLCTCLIKNLQYFFKGGKQP